jgi:hypothetical protein
MLPLDPRLKSKVVRSSFAAQSSGQVEEPSEMLQTEFPHVPTGIAVVGLDVGEIDGLGVGFLVGVRVGGLVDAAAMGIGVGFTVLGGIVGTLDGLGVALIVGFIVGGAT